MDCFSFLIDISTSRPAQPLPAPSGGKRLRLVRHGESQYNVYYAEHHRDPGNLWDAPLTAKGEEQAKALAERFAQRPDMIVSSPLTRAIQTALLAVPDLKGQLVVASALCSEHMEASCDLGRPTSQLRPAFPQVDFGSLPEVWWYVPEECQDGITTEASQQLFTDHGRRESRPDFQRRVDAFVGWLMQQPGKDIAIFAHADFCNCLLQRFLSWREARFTDYWMGNCELVDVELRQEDLENPTLSAARAAAKEVAASQEPAAEPVSAGPSRAAQALDALREELRQKHPELKPGELRSKAAKEWKAMAPEARAQYMAAV